MYGNGGKLEFEIRERNGVGRLLSRSNSSRKNWWSIFWSSVLVANRSSTSRGLWVIVSSSCARARSGVEENKLDYSEFFSEGGKERGGGRER